MEEEPVEDVPQYQDLSLIGHLQRSNRTDGVYSVFMSDEKGSCYSFCIEEILKDLLSNSALEIQLISD